MSKKPIAAILVGGLGTRLRPLTYAVPKPLIKINKKPFIFYLLSSLSSLGIKDVVLLVGYEGDKVRRCCGDGKKFGLDITYSEEKELLGTGGALLHAFPSPNRPVLLVNGDTYFKFDLKNFIKFHKKKKALISVYAIEGELADRGAIILKKSGRIKQFLEKQKTGFGPFNAGAYLIEPLAIRYIDSLVAKGKIPKAFSIEKDIFPIFAAKNKLFAYVAHGYFLDIGTFESLRKAQEFFKNKKKGKPAIFLDRDGVINKHRSDYVKTPEEFVFEEKALCGLKELSKLRLPIFIVTNQSAIGRGIITKAILKKIHNRMLSTFRKHKIRVDGIFVCPHKPEDNCSCRKPKAGMLFKIQKKFKIDLSSSFLLGDSSADIAMGSSVGCTTILLKKGLKGEDRKYPVTPSFIANNLPHAARIIKKLRNKSRK